ncbi:MAG: response regulator, partial [Gammaproteobacteria bacterium]|nr:response regulator [Gammaproteobacteria bacterium]
GTGLGLAISRQLIELMQGSIGIRDNSKGSTFWIRMPVEVSSHAPHENRKITTDTMNEEFSGMEILVADDNAINRKLITTLLEQKGVSIVEANDGNAALKLALNNYYDLIFMDIRMPGLNGVEVTKQLRASGINRNTPVIALTAHALPHEQAEFLEAGMDACITKPVLEDHICTLIDQWVVSKKSTNNNSGENCLAGCD